MADIDDDHDFAPSRRFANYSAASDEEDHAVAMMEHITPTSSADNTDRSQDSPEAAWHRSPSPLESPTPSRALPGFMGGRAAAEGTFHSTPFDFSVPPVPRYQLTRPATTRKPLNPFQSAQDVRTPRPASPIAAAKTPRSLPLESNRLPQHSPVLDYDDDDDGMTAHTATLPRLKLEDSDPSEDFVSVAQPDQPGTEVSHNGRLVTSAEVGQQFVQVLKEGGKLTVLMGLATAEWWQSAEMRARRRAAARAVVGAGAVVATGAGRAIMNGTPLGRVSRGVAEEVGQFREAPFRYAAQGLGIAKRPDAGGNGAQQDSAAQDHSRYTATGSGTAMMEDDDDDDDGDDSLMGGLGGMAFDDEDQDEYDY